MREGARQPSRNTGTHPGPARYASSLPSAPQSRALRGTTPPPRPRPSRRAALSSLLHPAQRQVGLKRRVSPGMPNGASASSTSRASACNAVSAVIPTHTTRGRRKFGNAPTSVVSTATGACREATASSARCKSPTIASSCSPRNFSVTCNALASHPPNRRSTPRATVRRRHRWHRERWRQVNRDEQSHRA